MLSEILCICTLTILDNNGQPKYAACIIKKFLIVHSVDIFQYYNDALYCLLLKGGYTHT
jgi:hypothetical protein